jgi:hypothetical protein
MANDIEIVVKGANQSKPMFTEIDRSLGGTRRQADAAAKSLDLLALAAEIAERQLVDLAAAVELLDEANPRRVAAAVDDIGDQARQAAGATDRLTDSVAGTSRGAAAAETAAAAVDDIGDQAAAAARDVDRLGDRLDRLDGIGRSAISRLWAQFREGLSGGDGGDSIGQRISTSLTASLSRLPSVVGQFFAATGPVGVAVAAGIAVMVSSAVGAGIAGAGLGGAAAGAIAIGIAAAAQDARVKSAAETLKASLAQSLADIGTPFVYPLISAMRTVKDSIGKLDLGGAFTPLAQVINPIVDGLFAMAQKAMPGVRQMLSAVQPLIMQVVSDLPELGAQIGDFADSLADAGPGAAKFFHLLVVGAGATLDVIGEVIEVLSKTYNLIATIGEKVGLYDFANFKDLGDMAQYGFQTMGDSADKAAASVMTLKDQIDALAGKNISAIEAENAYQAAVDAATSSLSEHGRTLDQNTDSGRQNVDALLAIATTSATAAQALFDQTYATQGETAAQDAAQAAWQRGRDQLVALAMSMGASAERANALATQIMGIPNFKTVAVSVDISAAEAALIRIRSQINALGRSIGPGEAASYYGQMTGAAAPRARGGPVKAGEAYVVGERQPELFIPDQDGVIMPGVPARGAMTPWSGSGSGRGGGITLAATINVTALDPESAASAVYRALDSWVTANGPLPGRLVSA